MALAAILTAMPLEDPKNVHPFFSKPSKDKAPELDVDDPTTNLGDTNDDLDYSVQDTSPKTSKPRKKRTRRTAHTKNQPSLDSFARRSAVQPLDADTVANADETAEATLEEDLNLDRRKRRKTASPGPTTRTEGPPTDLYQQLQAEAGSTGTQEVIDEVMVDTLVASTPKNEPLASSPPAIVQASQEEAIPESSLPQPAELQSRSVTPPNNLAETGNATITTEATTATTTPKKQIKVTKTGKLVSSPPKKPDPSTSAAPKRRGRPRKAAKNTNLSSTITILRYGSDSASRTIIGQKIDAILAGMSPSKHVTILPPKPAGPPKAPHPFFTGKAGQKKAEAPSQPQAEHRPLTPRKSACTPGKLRAERRKEQDDEDVPAFGMGSRNSRLAKQSGLLEPSWPSKETAHVRNFDCEGTDQTPLQPSATTLTLKSAKLKGNVYTLPADEEIITKLAQQLSKDLVIKSRTTDLDFAPPEDVRLPKRLLTTGIDIQHQVRTQIRAPIETLAQRLYAKTHTAITTLFDDIEHTLTPFDDGRCEPQAWTQKYRPAKADRVLQPGREASALKDWLKNLTVLSVGAAQDPSKAGAPQDAKKPPKKKRKTAVDDFIVSDDEDEDEEMIELPENTASPRQYPSLRRPRWTRGNNVVLLSGPHGCGKSATVYAVAKDLDFEVFELHSGVRRSGKDIQDKVGDMTANHLVNHQRGDMPAKPKAPPIAVDNDTDNERDKEFQKDLDSGRQKSMTSFFAAKPAAKSQPKPKPKTNVPVAATSPVKTRTIPAAQAMLPIAGASRKSQKQSLILIEEADILFEEDQNFWAQIIKLAAQSKRPIVITCNDELHIPTQALPMAAILRLTPPPVDLATDYLVALAGREGHILQRQAVRDLYVSKSHDLRASITDLNFWCQMSVGDKKGGLEWTYQRWPPGKDVDANGRLLRVASEDTYRSGMGWLSHNIFESNSNVMFDKEEELLTEVWNEWGISPDSWNTKPSHSNPTGVASLNRLVDFTDALSASDMYSSIDLPSYESMHDQPMDSTLPSITDKERLSYTVDAPLLQVDPLTDFLGVDKTLATQTQLLCQRLYPDLAHNSTSATIPTLEAGYTQQILHHKAQKDTRLTRTAFACLDILATPSSPFNTFPTQIDHRTSYTLTPSSLDRTLRILTLDLAPYVRSIVAHEQALEAQRIRLGTLLSEGGTGRAKRVRSTRAARTAMEGGERHSKRRERWFHRDLNFELVMRTAGGEWAALGWRGEGEGEDASLTGSLAGSLTGTDGENVGNLPATQRSVDAQDVEMVVDAEGVAEGEAGPESEFGAVAA